MAQEAAQAVEVRVQLPDNINLLEVIGSAPLGVVATERVRQVELASDERLQRDMGIKADRQEDENRGVRFLVPSFRLGDEHTFYLRV